MSERIYNRYFHTDALGSITAITDDNGNVVERRSYEPFGKIRAMDYGLTANNAIIPANTVTQTARAFTGHEQIAEISGLIHMNARLYDSDIGRFTSADTYIQAPENTQSYNRYSYVLNNPLVYTDPTGHFFKKLFKWVKKNIRTIAAIVVAAVIVAVTGGMGIFAGNSIAAAWGTAFGTGTFAAAAATGAVAGFASTLVATGSMSAALKGAFWGAVSAGVAWGIGHGTGIMSNMREAFDGAKHVMHGLSRAAISKLQTGSGKGGFLSGFASSLLGGAVKGMDFGGGVTGKIIKVTMAAVAGGTASVLGGGKFANGAMAGAFIMMFNDMVEKTLKQVKTLTASQLEQAEKDFAKFRALSNEDFDKRFKLGSPMSFGEIDVSGDRINLHKQLDTYRVQTAGSMAFDGAKFIYGSMGNPIELLKNGGVFATTLISGNTNLVYDFYPNSTDLRGIYEAY